MICKRIVHVIIKLYTAMLRTAKW